MPEASDRDQPLPDSSAASARSFDITQLVGSDDLALADALGGLAMWQTLPLFFAEPGAGCPAVADALRAADGAYSIGHGDS